VPSSRVADMHTHTCFSDGTCTPEELIARCKAVCLGHVAITDHDTTEGVEPAIRAAEKLGGSVHVYPGVEISTVYEDREVHLVGLFVDPDDARLRDALTGVREARVRRVYKITDKLRALDVRIDPDEVLALSDAGSVGRPHVAQVLTQHGHTRSVNDAFVRYIGDEGPAYVTKQRLDTGEAAELVHAAGGTAVLAHPGLVPDEAFIARIAQSAGLDAIEAYYFGYSPQTSLQYEQIARRRNLAVSGGSDFHGDVRPQVGLGDIRITSEQLDALARRAPSPHGI